MSVTTRNLMIATNHANLTPASQAMQALSTDRMRLLLKLRELRSDAVPGGYSGADRT